MDLAIGERQNRALHLLRERERERERGAGEPGSTSKQAGTIEGERGGQGNKHARGQGDV